MHVKNKITLLVVCILSLSEAAAQNYHNYKWTVYDTANHAVTDNFICDIVFDKKGNTWVTTQGLALHKFDGKTWKTIKPKVPDSLVIGWYKKMIILENGEFMILGIPGKLVFYQPETNTWRQLKSPDSVQFLCGALNENGSVLLGGNTSHGGCLFEYQNETFTLLQDTLADVFSIQMIPNGNALVSFRKGTYLYQLNKNKRYNKRARLINENTFYAMQYDKKGLLWGASYPQLRLQLLDDFSNAEFVNNIPQSVFYNLNGSWQYCAHTLKITNDGRKILGTQFGAHLAISEADSWEAYHLPMDENFDGIAGLTVAPDSSLWIATWHHGIYVFSDKNNKIHKEMEPIIIKQKSNNDILQDNQNYPKIKPPQIQPPIRKLDHD